MRGEPSPFVQYLEYGKQVSTKKTQTIFARATGAGRAGVAIVRVSGPDADVCLKTLTKTTLPKPRLASLRNLYAVDGSIIDQALVLRFKTPHSFTGEDLVELHIHGGEAVFNLLSDTLYHMGLSQAEAGEFTKRAFENGKLDLTEAEGLADLIDAQSEGQRRQALRQMSGGLRAEYESWREDLITLLALIDGELDFPDEGDVPQNLSHRASAGLDELAQILTAALTTSHKGEKIRHGLDVVVLGAPNAGKSSIINGLAKRDVAIVSNTPGTTRDIIEVHLEIGGLPVRLTDTAGLRESEDQIEIEGVKRARAKITNADIRIVMIDGMSPSIPTTIFDEILSTDLVVVSKNDLLDQSGRGDVGNLVQNLVGQKEIQVIFVNTYDKDDINTVWTALEKRVLQLFGATETAGLTRARHRDCVERALKSVKSARHTLKTTPELAGADLISALHALKELAGETDIEAVLDRVFSSFCIGK